MKKMIAAVIVFALVAASGLAAAQGWGRGYGRSQGGYAGSSLSAEQSKELQTLQGKFLTESTPWRNELVNKQFELRTLWEQASPEKEKILAKQREINALQAQLQEKATQNRLAVQKVLTPEQQARFGNHAGFFGNDNAPGMRRGAGPGCSGLTSGRGMGRGLGAGSCPWL